MEKGDKLLQYFVTVTFKDGSRTNLKAKGKSERHAYMALMRRMKRNDVKSFTISEGIPITKAEQEKAKKRKDAQRARRKREEQAKIMKSTWEDKLMSLSEHNAQVEAKRKAKAKEKLGEQSDDS